MKSQKRLEMLLRIICFLLFAGRAWQHIFWDIPLRSLLWDQDLMEGLITALTDQTWQEYATGETQDLIIQTFKTVLGGFYAFCAVLSLWISSNQKKLGKVLLLAMGLLVGLALLYFKEKFFHVGQLLEYGIQVACPLLLYLLLFDPKPDKKIALIGKVAVSLTFICHGLYAIGYYPQPGLYVDMTIRSFFLDEPGARLLLQVAGALDIAVGIGLFLPFSWRVSISYAVIWGLLTATARVTANFYLDFPWQSLHQWLPEMLYRLPHGLLPLFLLWHSKRISSA